MRFPELSHIQRRLGAEILTFPSAFTVVTGLAHWETILRTRAIGNLHLLKVYCFSKYYIN